MHGVEVAWVAKDYVEKPNVRRYVNQIGDGIDKESMWLVQMTRGIDQMKVKEGKIVHVRAVKAYRKRGIASLIPNLGIRWRWVVKVIPRALYPQDRTLGHVEQEAVWVP